MVYNNSNRWDYQDKAIEKVILFCKDKSNTKGLIVIPTGGGKTLTTLRAINSLYGKKIISKKVLWVSHLKTLNTQTKKVLNRQLKWGKFINKLEKVNKSLSLVKPKMVTEASKLIKVNKDEFELIIIDEAHHTAASGYDRLISSGIKVIGLTATPVRLDQRDLGYDKIIYQITPSDLFKREVIIEPLFERVDTEKTYDIKNLSNDSEFDVLNNPERNRIIIERIFTRKLKFTKVILFVRTKKHAKALMDEFQLENNSRYNSYYENIGWIFGDGNSDGISNEDFIAKNKKYKKSIIININVLTEGFDDPSINTVVMTCPSASTVYAMQAVGRALRRDPEKGDNQQKWYVLFSDNLPYINYRFESFWTYGEIHEDLEPIIKRMSYSSREDFINQMNKIINSKKGLKENCKKLEFKSKEIDYETLEDSKLILYNSAQKDNDENWSIIFMKDSDSKDYYLNHFNFLSQKVKKYSDERSNYNIQTILKERGIYDNDRFLGKNFRKQNFWESIRKSYEIIKKRGNSKKTVNRVYYYSFLKEENRFKKDLKLFLSRGIEKKEIYTQINSLDKSKTHWIIMIPFFFGTNEPFIISDETKIKILELISYFEKLIEDKGEVDLSNIYTLSDWNRFINEKESDIYDIENNKIEYERILRIVNNIEETFTSQEYYLKIYNP